MIRLRVGQKVKFDPFAELCGLGVSDFRTFYNGTVVYINRKHHWFSVVDDETKLRTSYHFCRIGKDVRLRG